MVALFFCVRAISSSIDLIRSRIPIFGQLADDADDLASQSSTDPRALERPAKLMCLRPELVVPSR